MSQNNIGTRPGELKLLASSNGDRSFAAFCTRRLRRRAARREMRDALKEYRR